MSEYQLELKIYLSQNLNINIFNLFYVITLGNSYNLNSELPLFNSVTNFFYYNSTANIL